MERTKSLDQRIREYFAGAKCQRGEFADHHLSAAKTSKWETERKTHENEAWLHGVYMQAVLNDMEKGIIKIIRQSELSATLSE